MYIGSSVQSTVDYVLEGFTEPAVPSGTNAEATTGTGAGTGSGLRTGTRTVTGSGTGSGTGTGVKAINPTGLPMNDILSILQQAVAECIDADRTGTGTGIRAGLLSDPSQLPANVPLLSLGMDSMRSIQLQALLECRFTVRLPDELMFEPDATLSTIAHGKKSCTMF